MRRIIPGVWVLATVAGLAGPAVLADESTRLHDLLAPAPSAEWVEHGPDPGLLIGPFDAHTYAMALDGAQNQADAEMVLNRWGLVAGYQRVWVQQGTKDVLSEEVFEFSQPAGARSWYVNLGTQDHQPSHGYKGEIEGLGAIPEVFGIEAEFSDGLRQYVVSFLEGNVMFEIGLGTYGKLDLAPRIATQAIAQHRRYVQAAPSPPSSPAATAAPGARPAFGVLLVTQYFWIAAAAGTLLALAAVGVAAFVLSRRPPDPGP